MRKGLCVLAMVLAVCLTAAAQSAPKAEAFLGYSYVRAVPRTSGFSGRNLNGGSGSLAFNVSDSVGLVADIGGYHVGKIGNFRADADVYSYMFGPRLTYRGGGGVTPFVQALFGGVHATSKFLGTSDSRNAFAMTLGGGVDAKVIPHVAVRLVQAEYFMTRFKELSNTRQTQNNFRLSTGLVFRF